MNLFTDALARAALGLAGPSESKSEIGVAMATPQTGPQG
jgi:hypothetical protein